MHHFLIFKCNKICLGKGTTLNIHLQYASFFFTCREIFFFNWRTFLKKGSVVQPRILPLHSLQSVVLLLAQGAGLKCCCFSHTPACHACFPYRRNVLQTDYALCNMQPTDNRKHLLPLIKQRQRGFSQGTKGQPGHSHMQRIKSLSTTH